MKPLACIRATLTTVAVLLLPALAHAQEQNFRVSFGVGATAGAIDGDLSLGGSFGYRFSKFFSFDVDVVGALGVADRFDDRLLAAADGRELGIGRVGRLIGRRNGVFDFGQVLPIITFPTNLRVETDGHTLLSTAGIRFLFPSRSDRFQPYVSGGFGVSRTEETFQFSNVIPGLDFDESTSHVGLVGTAGIGASFRVLRALSLDLDAKYYRLDRGRNLGIFGGGVSYRF
jgi:hypothetical protein